MRRTVSLLSAALLFCGAACFFALALATVPASGQVSNMNGVMTPSRNGLVYTNTNMNRAAAPAPAEESGPDAAEVEGPPPAPSLIWSPFASVEGYTTSAALKVRGSADARSAVSEESDIQNYAAVEVFESARDFLRVRLETAAEGEKAARRVEGWVEWGAAMPYTTALVIDARGGEVLRRVPLGAGVSAVTFSPDGRRALFHGKGTSAVYEADATDFRLTRVLEAEGKGSFGHAAFDASGRDVVVPFWASTAATADDGGETTGLHLLRVGEGGAADGAAAHAPPEAERFFVSGDNRLGFAFYCSAHDDEQGETGGGAAAASVEVFDLDTLTSLRRFRLPGDGPRYEAGAMALSHDGSELYLLTDSEPQRLIVVDTRSGGVAREVSLGRKASSHAMFTQPAFVGSALLLRQWHETPEGDGLFRALWLAGDKLTPAAEAFALAVEAGGTRYAVDEAGTQLFTLDANNRPRATRAISRPDLRQNDHAGQTPVGLFATPDGTRLILILAVPEDGC